MLFLIFMTLKSQNWPQRCDLHYIKIKETVHIQRYQTHFVYVEVQLCILLTCMCIAKELFSYALLGMSIYSKSQQPICMG